MALWKHNWPETRQHLLDWWDRKGVVLGSQGRAPLHGARPWADVPKPREPASLDARWTDPAWRAGSQLHRLANGSYPADIVPSADTLIGPGTLALCLGSAPLFSSPASPMPTWTSRSVSIPRTAGGAPTRRFFARMSA